MHKLASYKSLVSLLAMGVIISGIRWKLIFFCFVLTFGTRYFIGPVEGELNFQCPKTFFNFGTSLTDTGNLLNALPYSPDIIKFADPENPPYGNAFFRRPAKRYSNGRLIPDFISLAFDIPLLDTYSAPTVFNFNHGVNFAIHPVGVSSETTDSTFFLPLQIKQFIRFQSSALTAQSQRECIPSFASLTPRRNFQDALYMLEFGSSDIRSAVQRGVRYATIIRDIIPAAVGSIVSAVTVLYQYGARNFMIYNVYPQGCSPQTLTLLLDRNLTKDDLGCVVEINRLNEAFNLELSLEIQNLRMHLPDANITLFDFYSATMEIFRNLVKYGFDSSSALRACCGASGVGPYNYNPNITCAVEGSTACENADRYISWDGVHFTDSFYRTVSTFILNGRYTSPVINYSNTCNLNFTSFGSTATYEQVYGGLCNIWYA